MEGKNIIEANNVFFSYEKAQVLKGITFDIAPQTITAIIGPNGSGKTTLLKLMMGLLQPTSGSMKVLGAFPAEVRRRMGYVPQQFDFDRFFPITVDEFLRISSPAKSKRRVNEYLKHLGVSHLRDRLLGSLSGGQLQRVLIVRAVLDDPEVLFLDEPSAGIDVEGEKTFLQLISHLKEEHHMTIVIISHEVNVVDEFADQVICVNQSLICSGAPEHVLTKKTLEELYARPVALYKHHD